MIVVVRESLSAALIPAVGALYVGYTMPERVLRSMTRARAGRIRRALPDALDLLVLCVEAGQSLDQALVDTASELKRLHPDFGAELLVVHLELRAGKNRGDAMRDLADRNSEPELRKLATLLIQADRFGTSLGPALRVHAKYLRIRSKQQAEETARKISIKLLLPIFFLIFPAMMLVTAGPAILQIFTQLLPMIGGE
jgi:tight adherence protein C